MYQKLSSVKTEDRIQILLKKAGFKQPTNLQNKVFSAFTQQRDLITGTYGARGKRASFIFPVLASTESSTDGIQAVIIVPTEPEVRRIRKEFRHCRSAETSGIKICELLSDDKIREELKSISDSPDIIIGTASRIIDHIRRENISLNGIKTAVVDTPANLTDLGFDQDLDFIFSKLPERRQSIIYTERLDNIDLLEPLTRKPIIISMENEKKQETRSMKNTQTINEEEIEKKIKDFIKTIREDEDPDLLNTYKKLFKKHAPFSMRGYLSAFLLKQAVGKSAYSRPRTLNTESDSDKQTLFISIGRNRRVYPRDLSRLFLSSLSIDQSDIGNIKVLDSYSFVEITTALADNAIEILNGKDFKGRKLTVNYARKKS